MSTNSVTTNSNVKTGVNARYLTMTAMLSAIAFILMFLDFAVPFMPNFIKLDYNHKWCWRTVQFHSWSSVRASGRTDLQI